MTKLLLTQFDIAGPVLIRPIRHGDQRGWFSEVWNATDWSASGLPGTEWVQDNEAFSAAVGTLRGLHFQSPPHAQAKLVRAVTGSIFDVAVDIRNGSPSYGQAVTVTLSAETGDQFYVPAGFAHGYQTLEANTLVAYKCDAFYQATCEGGIFWSDPALGINWPLADASRLSDKDLNLLTLSKFESPFRFKG